MAQAPAHKLGQMIGDELEAAIFNPLQTIASEFGLYLDYKHTRLARGRKRKVTWTDEWGNGHDLDYVLERGGSDNRQGSPKAFVEIAWRRYTKHSRNKVGEIQGALSPLATTYHACHPFLGAVLAGEFTAGALDQMRSHGFNVVYCPYETMVQAFAEAGVDVHSTEDMPERELTAKANALQSLGNEDRTLVRNGILHIHADQFRPFFSELRKCLNRCVEVIFVLPLYGYSHSFHNVREAVEFITNDQPQSRFRHPYDDFIRYEVNVRYTNGDEVQAKFLAKSRAIEFLLSCDGAE